MTTAMVVVMIFFFIFNSYNFCITNDFYSLFSFKFILQSTLSTIPDYLVFYLYQGPQ